MAVGDGKWQLKQYASMIYDTSVAASFYEIPAHRELTSTFIGPKSFLLLFRCQYLSKMRAFAVNTIRLSQRAVAQQVNIGGVRRLNVHEYVSWKIVMVKKKDLPFLDELYAFHVSAPTSRCCVA